MMSWVLILQIFFKSISELAILNAIEKSIKHTYALTFLVIKTVYIKTKKAL